MEEEKEERRSAEKHSAMVLWRRARMVVTQIQRSG
jgi:hypothetical protein